MDLNAKRERVKIYQQMTKGPEKFQQVNLKHISLEDFRALLPKTIPEFIKEDIAFYFDYLRANRRKEALERWEQATGCTDSPNSWKKPNYRPIFSFLYYDRITDGLFLPLLLKKLEIAAAYKHRFTVEEFNKLCRLSIIGFRPKIDAIDLKILDSLSKEPKLVTQTLADKIKHSYATVYHHVQHLKAKMGLRITTRVSWAKLGIQRFFIITNKEELMPAFEPLQKHLDGKASFLWGEVYHLYYYIVDSQHQELLFQIYHSLPSKDQENISIYKLRSSPISGYNFESFNLEDQRWDFDFALAYFKHSGKKKPSKENNIAVTKDDGGFYHLTKLEAQIIEGLVGNYSLTQKEIAKMLGIHAPNLSIIKSKLEKDKIIFPQMMVNTFLPLNLVLWCVAPDNDIITILTALLQKLPFANISQVQPIVDSKHASQLLAILTMDDILYSSLITFLMELRKEEKLLDFRLGMIVDSYFGMVKVSDLLP